MRKYPSRTSCGTRAAALAILLLAFLVPRPSRADQGGREGETVPLIQTMLLDGTSLDLRSLAREKTILIFFWNAYKTMAIREINFLNGIYGYYGLYGLEIIAVEGSGKNREGAAGEVEKLKVIGTEPSYGVAPDPGGRLYGLYRVTEIPETFIINRGGRILLHLKGFREGDEAVLETKVKDLLGLLPAPATLPGQVSPSGGAPRSEDVPQVKKSVTVDPEQQLLEKCHYFGNYYFNRGDMELALENYTRCLEIDPRATEIHLRIGEIYAALKDYERAREAWEKVLQYDPANKEADALIRRMIRGEF